MRTWGYEALPLPGQPPPLAEEAPPGVHRYRPRPGLGHRPLPAGERGGGIFVEQDGFALSPQGGFFPTSETLFTFERQGGRWEARPLPEIKKQVLFGLHPCDAHGIALMDAPFIPPPQGYILQVRTARGAALFTGFNVEELEIDNPPPPVTTPVPVAGITEIARNTFNDVYWERLADRCIHCNLCAYVCPCCYCFDIRDYALKGRVERVRSWESCQAAGFTRLAGGFDPPPSKGARLRQRFFHKFLYYPTQFKGQVKCTGCGRCVRACPVNIDIREVASEMQMIGSRVARAA